MTDHVSIFVSCPFGLESVLQQEITTITNKSCSGGMGYAQIDHGSWADVYRLNLHCRTASRVLCRLTEGYLKNDNDIYFLAKRINWSNYFTHHHTFRVHVKGKKANINSLNILALKVKDAVCDHFRDKFGKRPNVNKENPDIRIMIFLEGRKVIIYLDTSGEALFKRGYKQETGTAPIRENLASGLLMLAGYDGTQSFIDPMCGSGTIAIEAGLIATKQAVGLNRHFAFEKLAFFDEKQQQLWQEIRTQAKNQICPAPKPIIASDISQRMVSMTIKNCQSIALDNIIQVKSCTFNDSRPPTNTTSGIIITNPPYGERIGDKHHIEQQANLWSACLKTYFSNWTAGFITTDQKFPSHLRLAPRRKFVVFNGAMECRLFLFDMIKGSNRRPNKS